MVIKKQIFIISILLFAIHIGVKAQNENLTKDVICRKDSLYVQFVGIINDKFEFEIINNTTDSVYLFDSYLFNKDKRISTLDDREIQKSKYLHRYDKKIRQCKLSFLPLLPYLTLKYNNNVVFDGNKVAYYGQVLYNFSSIPPHSRFTIQIHKDAICQKTYVKEINLNKISKFSKIKFSRDLQVQCQNIIVEFAVYKNINLLTSHKSFLYDEYNFNKQALSYKILSIVVD